MKIVVIAILSAAVGGCTTGGDAVNRWKAADRATEIGAWKTEAGEGKAYIKHTIDW